MVGSLAGGNRIIPARAGFTRFQHTVHIDGRDHPRSRGVYAFAISTLTDAVGSSPLARGLRGIREKIFPTERIIPARAGFTAAGHISW